MANIQKIERQTALTTTNSEYVRLVTQISDLWDGAREQAFNAVNTSLLMVNWKTGEYIVEFEQKGEARAKYGDALLVNLSNMYINYFKTEICQPDDNPPIGIVLGANKDELLMEYALAGIDNNLFAARYQLYLPNKAELQEQLNQLMES